MGQYEIEPLGYSFDALEPHIDKKTIEIHYDRLYRQDVEKLNWAVAKRPEFFGNRKMEEVLKDTRAIPKDIQKMVMDYGGSFLNHWYYFKSMSPNGGSKPMGQLARDINTQFGSFEGLQRAFKRAASTIYEPAWLWLVVNQERQLDVIKTLTQANPVSLGTEPLFGIDLWEHAYWLQYPDEVDAYLDAFWQVINLDFVEQKYEEIMK